MNLIRKMSIVLLAVLISGLNTVSAYAMTEGTYIVPLIVSYANPQTGIIVDGGNNEALGTSMGQSVMQADALIEQNADTAYVTVGIGLASNISNHAILLQQEAGQDIYDYVELAETGSCTRDNDTCIHYRFEMKDLDRLISPVLFVDPMGRDVQFFVQLDTANAVEGTGNYLSEMRTVSANDEPVEAELTPEVTPEIIPEPTSEPTPVPASEPTPAPTITPQPTQMPEITNEVANNHSTILIVSGIIAVIAIAGIVIARKMRGKKNSEKED